MDITLNAEEFLHLLKDKEIYLNRADQSMHIFNENSNCELLLNYKGYAYKPARITFEFEYAPEISLSESEEGSGKD